MTQAAEPSHDLSVEIRKIAVIGAGTAGRSFALTCAAAGFDVVLEDVMPARLRRAEAEFTSFAQDAPAGRLELVLTVEDAVRNADIAVDFVPDELESKLEIFSMIDRMAPPRTILCTPTSSMSMTDLASCVYRPGRCVGMRGGLEQGSAVRMIYPPQASEAVLTAVESFLRKVGLTVEREQDTEVPMLIRNLVRTDA